MVETASSRLRVRDHAILAALVASGWGLVEGSRAATPGAALVCAALLALAGAAFGVAQAGLLAALRALWRRARADWPAPVDREHQLRVRALAIAGTLCAGLALAALSAAVRRLLDADDRALVAALVVCAAALLAAGVLFAAPVVAGLLLGPLRTCHEESTHVPLLLRIPGVPRADVDLRVGLNDIAPTLVELLGLDVPADELDGQSLLLPALAPTRVPADRPVYCSVLSQRASQGNAPQVLAQKAHQGIGKLAGKTVIRPAGVAFRNMREITPAQRRQDGQ